MADDVGKIIGGILAVIVFVAFMGVMATLFSQLGDQQCQSYKDTIAQRDNEIAGLKLQINSTNDLLNSCNQQYEDLIKQNITKKDFEEIKGYYNITQIQINNLDQKFETVVTSFNKVYNTVVWNYRVSLIFNITIALTLLSLEAFSFFFLKSELIMFVISSIKKHRRREEEHDTAK